MTGAGPLPWVVLASSVSVLVWLRAPRGVIASEEPRHPPTRRVWLLGALVLGGGGSVWVLDLGADAGLAVCGVASVALMVRSLVRSSRLRRVRERRREAVIEFCDSLAAELHGGLPTSGALVHACAGRPEWTRIAATARLGGNVADDMRRLARAPGSDALSSVAAAWEVAASSGAALAAVLDRVACGLRSDEEARAEVTAALGPPRATAKLLAFLPVFGVLLGVSMGADPLHFLLSTSTGRWCLVGGVVLAFAGLAWVERLAAAAEVG